MPKEVFHTWYDLTSISSKQVFESAKPNKYNLLLFFNLYLNDPCQSINARLIIYSLDGMFTIFTDCQSLFMFHVINKILDDWPGKLFSVFSNCAIQPMSNS